MYLIFWLLNFIKSVSDRLRFQYLKSHNKGLKREKVERFHSRIPQLKNIQDFSFKYVCVCVYKISNKLETSKSSENCYLHNNHLLSTFYMPSSPKERYHCLNFINGDTLRLQRG